VIRVLKTSDPSAVSEAAAALAHGDVVALPTDTVYGLAVDPTQPEAVERLFACKGRPAEVPVPILVAGRTQVAVVSGELESAALVVPRHPEFSPDLGGPDSARQTVGVRHPDHPVLVALCELLGPLAVSSANRHGATPASTAAEVVRAFIGSDQPIVILDGGTCDGLPSTVVECRGHAARCLREGALLWSALHDSDDSDDSDGTRELGTGPGTGVDGSGSGGGHLGNAAR
jgi:L-threonylcarbamoyladenylate synthase